MAENYLDLKFLNNTSVIAEPGHVPISANDKDEIDDSWISANIARVADIEALAGAEFFVEPTVQNASFTAASGTEYRISASGSNKTVTLPAGPIDQSRIRLVGVSGGSALVTIDSQGAIIDYAFLSTASDYTFPAQGLFIELEYTSLTGRWHVRGDQPAHWFGDVGALKANTVLATHSSGQLNTVTLTDNTVLGRSTGPIVAYPVADLGTKTRRYLDAAAMVVGLLPSYTWSGSPSFLMTATANGALTVDGYAVTAGDLVVVNFEEDASRSGVFTVVSAGSAGTQWSLVRTYYNNHASGGENIFRVRNGNVWKGWSWRFDSTVGRLTSLPRSAMSHVANIGTSQTIYPGKAYFVVNEAVELTIAETQYGMDVLDSPRLMVKNNGSTGTVIETQGAESIEDPETGDITTSVGVYGAKSAVTWIGRPGEFGIVWYVESRQQTGVIYPPAQTYEVSSNTTAAADSRYLVDCSGGPVTITLPPAATSTLGEIVIKKFDATANAVTIDGNGAETIDGSATLVMSTAYEWARLISTGGTWAQIG